MSQRIPPRLKKKLEATMSSLSPRDSGRLWVIYAQEALKKGGVVVDRYPPITELYRAWDKRVEDVSRKGAIEATNRELALRNGFRFLCELFRELQAWADPELYRLTVLAYSSFARIRHLLDADANSEIARLALDAFNELPQPVSPADFAALLAWARDEELRGLDLVARDMVEARFKPLTFGDMIRDRAKAALADLWEGRDMETGGSFAIAMQSGDKDQIAAALHDLRRNWADRQDPDTLAATFGSREELDRWVESGEDIHIGQTRQAHEEAVAKARDRLADMLSAGELEGGQAFTPFEEAYPIAIQAGYIPAWPALKIAWVQWLEDRELAQTEAGYEDGEALPLSGLYRTGEDEDDLTTAEIREEVAAFMADVKAADWAAEVSEDFDLDRLAAFLMSEVSPLSHVKAPDMGRVKWESFKADRLADSHVWEEDVATVKSLRDKAEALGLRPADFAADWVHEAYYPNEQYEAIRRKQARATALLNKLRVSYRSGIAVEGGQPEELFGFKFVSPLREAINDLGDVFGAVASFKAVCARFSDEFFGGLPVLADSRNGLKDRLEACEKLLAVTANYLEDWSLRFASWPWKIDTSSLTLTPAEANEAYVKTQSDIVFVAAAGELASGRAEVDLGDVKFDADEIKRRRDSLEAIMVAATKGRKS